jgi:hypothetical protein
MTFGRGNASRRGLRYLHLNDHRKKIFMTPLETFIGAVVSNGNNCGFIQMW